jgi:hypothetical protein
VRTNADVSGPERFFMFDVGADARVSIFSAEVDLVHAPLGYIHSFAATTTTGELVTFSALRARLGLTSGPPIPVPVDFEWEARNPERQRVFFPVHERRTGSSWSLHVEGSRIQQEQGDFTTSAIFDQEVFVGALLGSLQMGPLRLHLRSLFRPAEFFTLESSYASGYRVLPTVDSGVGVQNRVTGEWAFGDGLPRVGVGVGVTVPAWIKTNQTIVTTAATFKLLEVGGALEPSFGAPAPIFDARATLSWQPHPLGAIAAELKYVNDPTRAPATTGSTIPADAARVYASLILQVRI